MSNPREERAFRDLVVACAVGDDDLIVLTAKRYVAERNGGSPVEPMPMAPDSTER